MQRYNKFLFVTKCHVVFIEFELKLVLI